METLVIGDKTLETSLKAQQDPVWLIGRSDGIRYLLSSIAKWSEDDVSSNYESVKDNLPVGLHVIGVALSAISKQKLVEEANTILKNIPKGTNENFPVLALNDQSQSFLWANSETRMGLLIQDNLTGGANPNFDRGLQLLRLELPLILEVPILDDFQGACASAFEKLYTEMNLEEAEFVFYSPDNTVPIRLEEIDSSNTGNFASCNSSQPVPLKMFTKSSSAQNSRLTANFKPFKGGPVKLRRVRLKADILVYYDPEAKTEAKTELFQDLRYALKSQLRNMEDKVRRNWDVRNLCASHFKPMHLGHHISIVKWEDDSETDQESTDERQQMHELWLLPTDRPLLRKEHAINWNSEVEHGGTGFLQNVHEGLSWNGVKQSEDKVHTIWGQYTYHHYMQNKFNDGGWGCAYRSLQTIWSWMQHQKYTNKPVPSHQKIQETLVDIGDKERSFVGSKQWIGAIELGFVLETLLGITSKVITVRSGNEMDSRAPEIVHHFKTQGSPIMIGGGVLAYTLLGIYYDPDTGDCQYLILDPHYTGQDDLKKIQNGKWIAWKKSSDNATAGGKLFLAKAFYNLLCPQRPQGV